MSHPARSHRHRRGYAARLALLVGAALTLLGVAAAPAALAQTQTQNQTQAQTQTQNSTTAAVAPWSDLSAAPAQAALATADRMPAFDSAFVVDKDGGITVTNFRDMQAKHPGRALEKAVKGMLPKGPLGYAMIKKLKVYAGDSHPHTAQQPKPLAI